jgi:uncharacterized membrane protein
MREIYKTK